MALIVPNCLILRPESASIHRLEIAGQFQVAWTAVETKCWSHHNGYARVSIATPSKPRTTGYKSQNHHLWGHAAQIGDHLGYDRREMVYIIAEMTNGWPMAEYKGKMVPRSESSITSEIAAQAIETSHRIAAENGIVLVEE